MSAENGSVVLTFEGQKHHFVALSTKLVSVQPCTECSLRIPECPFPLSQSMMVEGIHHLPDWDTFYA